MLCPGTGAAGKGCAILHARALTQNANRTATQAILGNRQNNAANSSNGFRAGRKMQRKNVALSDHHGSGARLGGSHKCN